MSCRRALRLLRPLSTSKVATRPKAAAGDGPGGVGLSPPCPEAPFISVDDGTRRVLRAWPIRFGNRALNGIRVFRTAAEIEVDLVPKLRLIAGEFHDTPGVAHKIGIRIELIAG